tara:strand:- start:501 stop:1262 length:762 start_codon:yes stop_codon:yes gene_type:complete
MIKNLLGIDKIKKLAFTGKGLNGKSAEIHVASFNHLQCPDISRAPATHLSLCGTSEKKLGSPNSLFPLKNRKQRKKAKQNHQQINSWLKLVKTLSQFGAKGQIAGINNFINNLANVAAIASYGKTNNWAAPVRYFRCEDRSEKYAVAKYLSLRLLGFHAERLRVVWLRAKGGKPQHAVLMVQLTDQSFVLDSRTNKITTDDMLRKEQPICSLNGSQFSVHWDAKNPQGAKKAIEHLNKYAHRMAGRSKLSAAA